MRYFLPGILLLLAPAVQADDARVVGNWKFFAIINSRPTLLYVLRISEADNKINGQLSPMKDVPGGFVHEVKVDGDTVRIKIRTTNGVQISFEGKLPAAAGKNINGSLEQFGGTFAAYLEPTKFRSRFEVERDLVEKSPNDPRVGDTVLDLLENASAEQAAVKDVQDWVELALRSAETHGSRWHSEMSIRLLSALAGNDYVDLAVTMSKKIEAGLDPKAPLPTRIRFLESMEFAFKKARKADEVKKITGRIDALENQAFAEHEKSAKDVPVKKFTGRKSDSKRAVLVELFTCSQEPQCVAADLAFTALGKTYQPTEVVLLQYHVHLPELDALANVDSMARAKYYQEALRGIGTPCILFNGKIEAPGGGDRDDARNKYSEYRGVAEQCLEKPTAYTVAVKAVRKGDTVEIKAGVSTTGKADDKIRLRLALVEDWVRFKAVNGILYHHRVVRAMPGGMKGFELPKKVGGDVEASVDLDTLRADTNKHLDDYAQLFPNAERPLRFRNLHVVAFVQDDASNEVLQAIDVPVKME
jgi:hypothetical protein